MWSIALKTLLADRGKLFTALVGVVFSIVLVSVQGGLFVGLIGKAGMLVDHGEADIWVGHRMIHNVDLPSDIPRRWIHEVRAIPGVRRAEPYLIGVGEMRLPSGGFEYCSVIGVEPNSLLGNAWNLVEGDPRSILQTDGVLIDECEQAKLGNPRVGDLREIGGRRARIVGKTRGITGFLIMPYVFTTIDRATEYLRKPPQACSYYLVQLDPGADPAAVCAAIRQRVPELDAYPRGVYSRITADYWIARTGLGLSFGAATLLGLMVGLVMVAQTLYALVLDRLSEFGTLKAIGATERQAFSLLFVQALSMAVVGSLIGLALVAGIQRGCNSPKAPIIVPWWLSLGSCLLVTAICLVAAVLPYARIRRLDPLTVLQS
jgi:putative ABC transport system permease protein